MIILLTSNIEISRFRKREGMVFRNKIKNGIVTRVAPCGFSKSSHKKMVKKKIVKDISLEDMENIGYAVGSFLKAFGDGINRGIKEDFNKSVLEVDNPFDI